MSNELAANIIDNLFESGINKYISLLGSIQFNTFNLIRNIIITFDKQYKESSLRMKY